MKPFNFPTRDDQPKRSEKTVSRKLSRQEAHDLGQIIKERTKVLEAHADEQAKKCLADFDRKLATIYQFDDDEVWKRATEEAMAEVKKAQEKIEAQCKKLGIPKDLSPNLGLNWNGRGQMGSANRRAELRRVAISEIDAMKAAAMTKIRKQSLDLRTQVVSLSLITDDAKMFLESLAPVEEAMTSVDFGEIEAKMLRQKNATRRLGHGGIYDTD